MDKEFLKEFAKIQKQGIKEVKEALTPMDKEQNFKEVSVKMISGDGRDLPYQKETELTPEMDNILKMIPEFLGNLNEVPGKTLYTFEFLVKALQAIKKETEQSLKQKVEKMLEGMRFETIEDTIRRTNPTCFVNWEYSSAEEKRDDEWAIRHNKTLEEAKNNLEDL